MLTQTSARDNTTSDDIGFSVFASDDGPTLETLNRCADEEVLPRSWLIGRVLKEWARQQHDSRSDTVMVEEGREMTLIPDAVEQIIAGGGSMLDLVRRRELTHNS
jgi:hypothetical protein